MRLTWLGHSAFRLEVKESVILIDPFLSGSPVYSGTVEEAAKGCTHVALTHGHDDHIGDTHDICTSTGAQLIAAFEICAYMGAKGVENVNPGNAGGTVQAGDVNVTFVPANHSSATIVDGAPVYMGNPLGLVFEAEGEKTLYHMGDTNMFADMALIEEFHSPDIGIVPIGDRFTMGGRQAAIACERYFNFEKIVPCHFGTFPILDQNLDKFSDNLSRDKDKVAGIKVGDTLEF